MCTYSDVLAEYHARECFNSISSPGGVVCLTAENVEVCSGEIFTARCGPDEVIVMDTAIYGRMSVGKCIRKQQDHMGCSNEVCVKGRHACIYVFRQADRQTDPPTD